MAFIPVPNVAQFNVRATYNLIDMENVLHFRSTSTPITSAILFAGAQTLGTSWATNIVPLLNNDYRMTEIFAIDLTSQTGPAATDNSVAGTVGGDGSGEGAPGNVAIVITHATALRGRSYRGRTYFVGLTNSKIAANQVSESWLSDLADAMKVVNEDMTSDFGPMVIVSRFHNGAPRATGVATDVTNSFYRNTLIDTQRRRLS